MRMNLQDTHQERECVVFVGIKLEVANQDIRELELKS